MDIDEVIAKIKDASESWDNIPRYVIRGKPDDPEWHDQVYGVCGCDISSNMVFLYTEEWQVKERFDELRDWWKKNSHTDFAEHFEIHRVTKDELYSTFKKARII